MDAACLGARSNPYASAAVASKRVYAEDAHAVPSYEESSALLDLDSTADADHTKTTMRDFDKQSLLDGLPSGLLEPVAFERTYPTEKLVVGLAVLLGGILHGSELYGAEVVGHLRQAVLRRGGATPRRLRSFA